MCVGTPGPRQGLTFGGVEAPCPPPVLGVVVDKHVVRHSQDVAVHVHRRRHDHLWDSRLRATAEDGGWHALPCGDPTGSSPPPMGTSPHGGILTPLLISSVPLHP